MSFGDHLEELRSRLIKAAIAPIPLIFILWPFSDELLHLIMLPLQRALSRAGLDQRLQVLSPPEALLTQLKISILAAVILAAPWILYQTWQFVRPGLFRQERRFVYLLIPGSMVMTVLGVVMLYFGMLPLVLVVLVGFGAKLDPAESLEQWRERAGTIEVQPGDLPRIPMLDKPPAHVEPGDMWLTPKQELIVIIRSDPKYDPDNPPIDKDGNPVPPELDYRRIPLEKASSLAQVFRLTTYVNFVLVLTLGMVIAFQTPLVMVLLGWVNLASVPWLRRNRKYALFVTAALSAVLTPADPWSMIAMWVPLYALFEFGIVLMRLLPARRVAEGRIFGRGDRDQPPPSSNQSKDPSKTVGDEPREPSDDADRADDDGERNE